VENTLGSDVMRKTGKMDKSDRRFLTAAEVDRLMVAAGQSKRNGTRNRLMILLAFRHGLRRSELVGLRWEAVDFPNALLTVTRLKGGIDSRHPIQADEMRLIRRWKREQGGNCSWLFHTPQGSPMLPDSFRKILRKIGKDAGFDFPVHPHMLRHGCGYALVEQNQNLRSIQHYLGHKAIKNTLIYTELNPRAFKDFWK